MALLRPINHRRPGPGPPSHGTRLGWLVVCGLIFLSCQPAPAQDLEAPEYKLKAAFLYNFTKLVDWPGTAFTNRHAPLVVGVLGRDPFGKELDRLMAGRLVNGRRLATARFNLVTEATNCHLLFISESERRKLDSLFEALQGKPVLTVGDVKGFEARGMITLVRTNETIDLRINLEAARQAGLQLSSRLTRLDKSQRPLGGGHTNAPPLPQN